MSVIKDGMHWEWRKLKTEAKGNRRTKMILGVAFATMEALAQNKAPEKAEKEGRIEEITEAQACAAALLVVKLSPRGKEYQEWWKEKNDNSEISTLE